MSKTTIRVPADTFAPRDGLVISQVTVVAGVAHDVVHVFNRGAKAGELTVRRGDGDAIGRWLLTDGKNVTEGRGAA